MVRGTYFVFKFFILACLFVGLGISRQCNDQAWEICQFVRICGK